MFDPDGPSLAELTRQALSSTRAGYDLLAPKFDTTPFRTPDDLLEQVAAHLAAGPPVGAALDLCCGTGAAMAHLRPLCDALVGLDFSPGMLAEAERRVSASPGRARLEFVQGDARALPYQERFDLVTCFGAFGHIQIPEQPAFLRGIHRALRPGGRFVFVTGRRPSRASAAYWALAGFNAVMRVRNRLMEPAFIMYYLEFLVPDCLERLEAAGFEVATHPVAWRDRPDAVLVEATRPAP